MTYELYDISNMTTSTIRSMHLSESIYGPFRPLEIRSQEKETYHPKVV